MTVRENRVARATVSGIGVVSGSAALGLWRYPLPRQPNTRRDDAVRIHPQSLGAEDTPPDPAVEAPEMLRRLPGTHCRRKGFANVGDEMYQQDAASGGPRVRKVSVGKIRRITRSR